MANVSPSSTAADPVVDYAPNLPGKPGRVAFWVGWVLSGLIAIAFVMGGVTDLIKPPFVVEGLTKAGFREEIIMPLGLITIVSTILLTAYLGGAVSIHVRAGEYGQMLVPVVFAVVMWVGLVLRDGRVRTATFG